MKSKIYRDKNGFTIKLRRNKNGSFNLHVSYDKNHSGSFLVTKQDFEMMKELDNIANMGNDALKEKEE